MEIKFELLNKFYLNEWTKEYVTKALQPLPLSIDGPWVAGGFPSRIARGDAFSCDLDIFCANTAQLERFKLITSAVLNQPWQSVKERSVEFLMTSAIEEESSPFEGIAQYLYTLVTKTFYPNLYVMFESFPFTATQFATDGALLAYTDQGLEDARNRILRPVNTKFFTRKHIQKYLDNGFQWVEGFEPDWENIPDVNYIDQLETP